MGSERIADTMPFGQPMLDNGIGWWTNGQEVAALYRDKVYIIGYNPLFAEGGEDSYEVAIAPRKKLDTMRHVRFTELPYWIIADTAYWKGKLHRAITGIRR